MNRDGFVVLDPYPSTAKKVFMEVGFFVLTLVWIPVSVADLLVVGLVSAVVNKARGKKAYYPPLFTTEVWRMIWKHLRYLYRCIFKPTAVAAAKEAREKGRGYKEKAFDAFGRVTNNFDDVMSAYAFFTMLPHFVTGSLFVANLLIAIALSVTTVTVVKREAVVERPTEVIKVEPTQIFVPQIADKQDLDFGPWVDRSRVLKEVSNYDFRFIAFLSNTGQIQYSEKKVGSAVGFMPTPFHERVNSVHKIKNSQIGFKDQFGNSFAVNPFQVFIFEGYASKAFLFSVNGELFTLPQNELEVSEEK